MDSGGAGKRPVRVSIFNQTYTLRSSGDSREIEELARQIDSLMESIAAKSGDGDASRVAVLASLHLADRLRAVEKELEDLRRRVEEKSTKCALLLDQALEDG
jgi:cell division protein ZapA (FtsZ GTPase activity inhibitor)